MSISIKTKMASAIVEKDVENIYREAIMTYLKNAEITSPFSCDGLLKADNIRTIMEFKYQDMIKNKLVQSNILVQILYYLKKFETTGEKLPTTIFVGDKNECFALNTKTIVKYLDSKINWELAPSSAHKFNPQLIKAMVDDIDILPFVFDIDDNFTIDLIINKILELGNNGVRKVKITSNNISPIFEYFEKNVISSSSKLKTNEKANLFVQILINPNENYIHPKKHNILCTKTLGDVPVNGKAFMAFFAHFEDRIYSPKEKEAMTSLIDRLVEDNTRRSKGEFYTPTIWVDEAHKMITETFGENWKDEYIVWDCCAGTLNLTRDYNFKNLFVSTIEQSDIDTANQIGYNTNSTKFQFDFLNDKIFDDETSKSKVPRELQKALKEGKKIIFLINPPYATASNKEADGTSKKGVSKTRIETLMKNENWGNSSTNLYAQFLYLITKLNIDKNINIALFSPSLYKTGESYKLFRKNFYQKFHFESSMIFNAKHFSDTADSWAIDFSIWKSGMEDRDSFISMMKDISPIEGIINLGEKDIYNLDNHPQASKWIRNFNIQKQKIQMITLKSFNNLGTKTKNMYSNFIGGFECDSNNIYANSTCVALYSVKNCNNHGSLDVIPENFEKVCALFTARKAITSEWYNQKDEYYAPNESNQNWKQFCADSIIYSLFNNSSQQSSLRNIEYNNKIWNIKNEWFFMKRNEMINIANEIGYDEIYHDAKNSSDSFVCKKLEEVYPLLSNEAKDVLNMAKELTIKSMDMRKLMADMDSSLHLNCWDAGWSQIKLVLKQYHQEELKEFRSKYKKLEDKLIPMIYELNFLKQ